MDPKSQAYQTYQAYLRQSLEQNTLTFGEDSDKPEGMFFALSAHSYLAMVAAEEKEYMKVVGNPQKAKEYDKQSLELAEYESTLQEAKQYMKNA